MTEPQEHYPERASAYDFKVAATQKFSHSNVVFDLCIGTCSFRI